MHKPTIYFITILLLLSSSSISSAQPGINEFYTASREVSMYYFSLSSLMLAIGAVCGVLGGLRIYNNWQLGKSNIDAQVTGWLLSCIFLSLLSNVVKLFFS